MSHFPRFLTRIRPDEPLVLLLLLWSGNPAVTDQPWSKAGVVLTALCLMATLGRKLPRRTLNQYLIFTSIFLLIFFVQVYTLGFVSKPFVVGFLLKIYIGAIIITKLGREFPIALLNCLVVATLVSFPFYLIHFAGLEHFLVPFSLTPYTGPEETFSIGLYTVRPLVPPESILRNSGIFWEPGAFQGFINIAFLLNFHNIPRLLRHGRFRLLVLLLGFFTTFSTTGYLVFFLILVCYLAFYSRLPAAALGIASFGALAAGLVLFLNADFLQKKISSQMEDAVDLPEGEFSNQRMGSLKFDMYYIRREPVFGNGFHESTRFRYHPELLNLIEDKVNLGHGNGFSNFVASAGILGTAWYFFMLLYFQRKSLFLAIILGIALVILLQGEQFLNFPFFLALPFIVPSPSRSRWRWNTSSQPATNSADDSSFLQPAST
jgi:hypothetical protein